MFSVYTIEFQQGTHLFSLEFVICICIQQVVVLVKPYSGRVLSRRLHSPGPEVVENLCQRICNSKTKKTIKYVQIVLCLIVRVIWLVPLLWTIPSWQTSIFLLT